MKRESAFLMVLLIILVASSSMALEAPRVEASVTIYIRADGSIDPPDAPISTVDNVTYTLAGNITSYSDGIVIERGSIVVDGQGYTVQGTWGGTGITLSGRSNVTIKNTEITAFTIGVWLSYSSNSSISGNNITNNGEGIKLSYSSNSSISRNNITANGDDGIWLAYSTNNSISGNNMTDNSYGIWLNSSSNNSIDQNNIASNWDGILLLYSSNNSMNGNNVTNNTEGITLSYSNNNSMSGNTIAQCAFFAVELLLSDNNSMNGNNVTNTDVGIVLYESSNNTVYHNNFINNTVPPVNNTTPEYANFWDNNSEGNYWSFYSGFDGNQDGIGEVQYLISEGELDHYPLMHVYWNPCDINHDLEVNKTDIDISANAFGTRSGDSLWNPHADITGPEPLVPDRKVDMRDIGLVARHFGEHYT